MRKHPKGHQRSRLRVDPFILLQLLTEQQTTLSAVQQRTGFAPSELEALRTAHKIHLDTLNRLAAGLNVPPNSLLITPDSPFSFTCPKEDEPLFIVATGYSPLDGIDPDADEWNEDDPPEDNPLYL